MKNKKIKLSELIESPITGEWGKEIGKSENPNTVKVIRTTNFTNSGEINYSNITLRDIESQKCEKKRLKYGDIILEKSGGTDLNPVGRVVFFDKDDTNDIYLTNNFTTILRVKDKRINSKFLLLFLLYNYKYRGLHKFYNKTTGIQNLQVSNFINQVFVPLPEIEIQNKIIKVLENIKTVIKKQKEQLELLENLKKSQFFELFGDPIKNEKGWKVTSFDEISIKKGEDGSNKPSKIYEGGYRYIRITDIKENGDLKEEKVGVVDEDIEVKKYKLEEGDILFARSGATVGKTFLYRKEFGNCIFAGYLIRFKLDISKVNPEYIKRYTETEYYKKWVESCQNVVAQPNINAKKYGKELKIILPPLELQNKFATKIEAIQKLKFEIEKSLKETENLYNSLMQKFFSNK